MSVLLDRNGSGFGSDVVNSPMSLICEMGVVDAGGEHAAPFGVPSPASMFHRGLACLTRGVHTSQTASHTRGTCTETGPSSGAHRCVATHCNTMQTTPVVSNSHTAPRRYAFTKPPTFLFGLDPNRWLCMHVGRGRYAEAGLLGAFDLLLASDVSVLLITTCVLRRATALQTRARARTKMRTPCAHARTHTHTHTHTRAHTHTHDMRTPIRTQESLMRRRLVNVAPRLRATGRWFTSTTTPTLPASSSRSWPHTRTPTTNPWNPPNTPNHGHPPPCT